MQRMNYRARRGGFTLIELLVVVALIGILVALLAGVAWNVVDSQRAGRTDDAIRIIDKVFKVHWKKVIEDANKEQISPAVLTLAQNDEARARVLHIKLRLAEAFPQSYQDVVNAASNKAVYNSKYTGLTPLPSTISGMYYQTYNELGGPLLMQQKYTQTYYTAISKAGTGNAATQSSACLLLALSQNRGGNNKIDLGNLTANVADTDQDGLKEFVDTWNQTMRFVRFPIYAAGDPTNDHAQVAQDFLNLDPRGKKSATNATAKYSDPLDPNGTLQELTGADKLPWFRTQLPNLPTKTAKVSCGEFFAAVCDHPFPTNALPQPYWVPLIASNGSDTIAYTSDDHYNYRLIKVGAQGD